MLFDDLLRDCESQPDAAKEIVLMSFKMIETIKDARQLFFFDSDAVIFHREQNIVAGILSFVFYGLLPCLLLLWLLGTPARRRRQAQAEAAASQDEGKPD